MLNSNHSAKLCVRIEKPQLGTANQRIDAGELVEMHLKDLVLLADIHIEAFLSQAGISIEYVSSDFLHGFMVGRIFLQRSDVDYGHWCGASLLWKLEEEASELYDFWKVSIVAQDLALDAFAVEELIVDAASQVSERGQRGDCGSIAKNLRAMMIL